MIWDELVHLSQMVDQAIMKARQALTEFDLKLAEEVIANDLAVNQLRFKIEVNCMALIAARQPAASDLRAVIAVMHMVVEMERMGDHAAGIARTVIMMSEEPLLKILKKIPRMGELSRAMLADWIQAF